MSDTPTETEARLARSVVGQGRTSLVATAIREAQDAWPTRLGVSMPMTDPMELAARAIAVLLCDEGRNFDACDDRAGQRDTVCSCRAEAKACITAYLTAALADPATVERVARALCEDHDVNWAKYPALFTEDALTALSAIKALADE